MASVYKRPGSKIYQAQFYVTDPVLGKLKKVRKSTGSSNRKKAFEIAVELERNAQAVIQSGSERASQAKAIFASAVSEIERETFTAPKARKYMARLLGIATGEEMAQLSIEEWISEGDRQERDLLLK